jgi:hypothetical protein
MTRLFAIPAKHHPGPLLENPSHSNLDTGPVLFIAEQLVQEMQRAQKLIEINNLPDFGLFL